MSGSPLPARHGGPQPTTRTLNGVASLGFSNATGWPLEGKAETLQMRSASGAGEPEGLFALVRAGVIHQLVGMRSARQGTNTSLSLKALTPAQPNRQAKPFFQWSTPRPNAPCQRQDQVLDQAEGRRKRAIDDRRPHAVLRWSIQRWPWPEPPWRRRRRSAVIAIAAVYRADLQRLTAFLRQGHALASRGNAQRAGAVVVKSSERACRCSSASPWGPSP